MALDQIIFVLQKHLLCHFLQIGFRAHVVFIYRIHTRIVQCHIHIILNLAVFHKEIAAPLIPVIFTV